MLPVLSYACDSYRDDVAVIYNINDSDSLEIAQYYASERCVNANNLIGVYTQRAYDIHWDEFLSINSQIIEALVLLVNNNPNDLIACNNDKGYWCEQNTSFIQNNTSITTLVTVKGVPTRLYQVPFEDKVHPKYTSNYNQPGVVDTYLRLSLLSDISSFDEIKNGGETYRIDDLRSKLNSGLRRANPAIDDDFIIGRIDGLNKQAAKNLVDRAKIVEVNGIKGVWYVDADDGYTHGIGLDHYRVDIADDLVSNDLLLKPFNIPIIEVEAIRPSNRYLLGIVNETDPACNGFFQGDFYLYDLLRPAPYECLVKYTTQRRGAYGPVLGKEGSYTDKPGFIGARSEIANNALVYFGRKDAQSTYWPVDTEIKRAEDDGSDFRNLLNWKKNPYGPACQLCDETADTEVCKAESTDALREIDTRCAGVEDGFFGYNNQSYPAAYFTAWPTGWRKAEGNSQWLTTGSGDWANLAFPIVLDDYGYDDNYSLNFTSRTEATDQCLDIQSDTLVPCSRDKIRVLLEQRKNITPVNLSPQLDSASRTFTVRFRYQFTSFTESDTLSLAIRVVLRRQNSIYGYANADTDGINNVCFNLSQKINLQETAGSWNEAVFTYEYQPDLACYGTGENQVYLDDPESVLYDGIKLGFVSGTFSGDLKIDAIELENPVTGSIALNNASFFESGFQQSSPGDFPVMFLSRLNGTAFWGSVSHHVSGGAPFSDSRSTISYFLKGLPLGEAVWADNHGDGSGVFYGDPLYNPIAVRLNNLASDDLAKPNFIIDRNSIDLYGIAKNGTANTSQYYLDYCSGHEFVICDRENSWQSIPTINGGAAPTADNTLLGTFDMSDKIGEFLVRLTVTTQIGSESSSYSDYLALFRGLTNDLDVDGIPDDFEQFYGIEPHDFIDVDSDGINDEWEFYYYRTATEKAEDEQAIANGETNDCDMACQELLLARENVMGDMDNDGYTNYVEFTLSTDPADAGDTPSRKTVYYRANAEDGGNGTYPAPYNHVSGIGIDYNVGDILVFIDGQFSIDQLNGNSVYGNADNPVELTLKDVLYSHVDGVRIYGGYVTTSSGVSRYKNQGSFFNNTVIESESMLSSVSINNTTYRPTLTKYTNSVLKNRFRTTRNDVELVLDHVTIKSDQEILSYRSLTGTMDFIVSNSILDSGENINAIDITKNGIVNTDIRYSLVSDVTLQGTNNNNLDGKVNYVNDDLKIAPLSKTIDAGDPDAPYDNEAKPHGDRVNLGAYGNTSNAQFLSLEIAVPILFGN